MSNQSNHGNTENTITLILQLLVTVESSHGSDTLATSVNYIMWPEDFIMTSMTSRYDILITVIPLMDMISSPEHS